MEIEKTQRALMTLFWGFIVLSVIIVAGYETEWVTATFIGDDPQTLFGIQIVLELATIVAIPVALRLFRWNAIASKLKGNALALRKWGSIRILLLCVPMLCNTICYEQTQAPSFGYLAVIVLLCLCFIYPSADRCRADMAYEETSDGK